MAELMTNGADAVKLYGGGPGRIAGQLHAAGVVQQRDAVFHYHPVSPTRSIRIKDNTAVRPPQPAVVATVVGTITGNDEVHQINHSVTVTVILTIIDIRVSQVKYGVDYFISVFGSINVILAVIYRIRSDNIELWLELGTRIIAEIVTHTTRTRHKLSTGIMIAGIVLLVDHVIDIVLKVST